MEIYFNKDISLESLKSSLVGFFSGFLFCFLIIKFKIKYIPLFLKKILNEPSDEERRILKGQLAQLNKQMLKLKKTLKKIRNKIKKL